MKERLELVFDAGAHRREDSDFYLKLGYTVVAVEANPELVAHLEQRFAREIDHGTYVLADKAIGDHAPLSRVAGLLRRIPLLRRAIPRVSWYDTHAMRS